MIRKSHPSFTLMGIRFFTCLPIIFHTLLFFIVFPLTSFSQGKNVFCRLSSDDGLSTNNIKCTTQDNKGFIWIGTSNGLQRYDGNRFIYPKC
ncbi:MAG: two-component regulator propeller domain-containing protein, partial [Flavisolibacter sp.]